jgi:hypothetical protein
MAVQYSGIPLWVKVLYTAFMAVLVPVYWHDYGPANFLYFCDLALFFTLAAMWTEHPLLASMPAVGILVPQLVWMVDFLGGVFGYFAVGMTKYMFDPNIQLFTRGLSFFHFWLPILLVWMVWRLGYDRRALVAWTLVAWFVLWICYKHMPPPRPDNNPDMPANINYVFGMDSKEPQTWLAPDHWFVALMVGLPLFAFLPSHFVLMWIGKRRA